jgi:hypothetical protein
MERKLKDTCANFCKYRVPDKNVSRFDKLNIAKIDLQIST